METQNYKKEKVLYDLEQILLYDKIKIIKAGKSSTPANIAPVVLAATIGYIINATKKTKIAFAWGGDGMVDMNGAAAIIPDNLAITSTKIIKFAGESINNKSVIIIIIPPNAYYSCAIKYLEH